jgi:hypothetical protein
MSATVASRMRLAGRLAAIIALAKRRQRRRRVLLAAAAAAACAAGGLYVGVWRGGGAAGAPPASRGGLAVTRFRLDGAPVAVALAGGSVWVVEETAHMRAELVRLDSTTRKQIAAFAIGRTGPDFGAATASGRFVWAAAGHHLIRVSTIDPHSIRRTALRGEAAAVTVGFGSVWVASIGQSRALITRLDVSTLTPQARIAVTMQPVALQAGLGSIWLASTDGIWRIEPKSNRLAPGPAPVASPVRLALSHGRLWLIEQDRVAAALDRTGHIRARITLPFAPGAVAATASGVWISDDCGCRAGRIALFDPRTHRLLGVRRIGETPVALAADHGGSWVATFGDESISLVRTAQ